jgi:hypothetical protein
MQALRSVQKYPLPLKSGQEAMMLEVGYGHRCDAQHTYRRHKLLWVDTLATSVVVDGVRRAWARA